jgi:ribose transport system substrate-binding protein
MTSQPHDGQAPARNVDEAMEQLDTHGVHRRQFVKLLAGTLVAGGAANFLSACGSTGAASGSAAVTDGKFALLNWSAVGDYGVQWGQAFQAASTKLGYKSVVLDGKFDAAVQQNQFNELLTQKTSAILIGANDAGVIPTLARGAERSKIYLNAGWGAPAWYTPWDAKGEGEFYNSFLIPDELAAVQKVTEVLIKAGGEDATYARVGGYATTDATESQRRVGANRGFKAFPKIKYVGELNGKYDPELSQKAAATLIAKYPDLRGIVAVNDDVATGVVAAIKAAGKVPGKDILVVGANGSTDGIKRVADGTQLATTGNIPAYPAVVSVDQYYDRLHGWKPEQAERQYGWHQLIITADNVDVYKKRYVDGPIGDAFDVNLLSRVKSPKTWDTQNDAYPIENLQDLWPETPRPKDHQLPAAYVTAQKNGDFARIAALWKEHYKTPALGPAPGKA